MGSLILIKDLKIYNFEKVFIFNSSLRFNLISKLAGIKNIYQYPLFKKKNQHIIQAAQKFLKKELNLNIESNPIINLEKEDVEQAKITYSITNNQTNILLGIGGSGPTKRIPARIFIQFMRLVSKENNCKFFLATGKNYEEQIILKEIINSELKDKCIPLDYVKLKNTLPIIKKLSDCNLQ